ncbi:hypothetical protein Hdeb2414_s0016g00498671 [Helianthus debilis subsp. tardiflorus]
MDIAAQKTKKTLVILIIRVKPDGDPSRILYPTMSGPLLGQILPIRDGISSDKKESSLPICIIFCNFKNRMILPSFPFQQISVRTKRGKIIKFGQLCHPQINSLLLDDPLEGIQNPPDHRHGLNVRDAG